MVFGWRASKVAATQRPKAPGVEEILADLESTDSNDPVFALSSDLLKGWLEKENSGSEDISDPNVLYDKVTNYVNSKEKLKDLESKILSGTESLEHSLIDLKQLAKEVQLNLEAVKNNQALEPTKQNKDAQILSAKENTENLETPDQENLESDKEVDTGTAIGEKAESENISDSDEVNLC